MREAGEGRDGYHHGDLRNALVLAAADLARDGGPEAVVLRAAARRVGVSPTAAYRHFANQADLLHAVKTRGLNELVDSMARLIEDGDRPKSARETLYALGLGYLRFALAEPGLYRTAFCHVPATVSPELVGGVAAGEAEDRSFLMLTQVLDGLDAAGVMRQGVRPGAEFAAWSAVHGLAMLLLDGPLAPLPEQARDAAIDHTLNMVLYGLTVS